MHVTDHFSLMRDMFEQGSLIYIKPGFGVSKFNVGLAVLLDFRQTAMLIER